MYLFIWSVSLYEFFWSVSSSSSRERPPHRRVAIGGIKGSKRHLWLYSCEDILACCPSLRNVFAMSSQHDTMNTHVYQRYTTVFQTEIYNIYKRDNIYKIYIMKIRYIIKQNIGILFFPPTKQNGKWICGNVPLYFWCVL